MEHEIFLAYAHEDAKAAQSVVEYLSSAGLHCWWDDRLVPGTPEWEAEIERAIRHTGTFIALISPHSVVSRHVKTEMTLAGNTGKGIIPVFLCENVDLPNGWGYRLALHQHLYASPSLEAVLPKLAAAVDKVLDSHRHPAAYREEQEVRQLANFSWQASFAEETGGLNLGESEGGSTSIEAGAYLMASKPNTYLGSMMHALPALTEFILEARVNKSGGTDDHWFGFEFGEPWPQNYYQFLINGQNTIRIAKHWNREWIELARHRGVRQLNPGNASNLWKIIRKGPYFHVFINGLHAQSVMDGDIKKGTIGMVIGPGLRVAYEDLALKAVNIERVYEQAASHWKNLEIREARQLFQYVADYDQSYKNAKALLIQPRPDYRESILIIVGFTILPQIFNIPAAVKIMQEINKRGRGHEFRWARIVTDAGLLRAKHFIRCPLIAIGGPKGNKVSALVKEELVLDPASFGDLSIRHNLDMKCLEGGSRRVALWGHTPEKTEEAVDLFISSGLLDRFLTMIWGKGSGCATY
jgi:hypothetical protein